jgi:hypothetical protein
MAAAMLMILYLQESVRIQMTRFKNSATIVYTSCPLAVSVSSSTANTK